MAKMENPAGGRGNPVAASLDTNSPEFTADLRSIQVIHLTRRCAISLSMAAAVAPLLHGEVCHD